MTKTVRSAIYCRKSSDEGLDQNFTSLDAQRASAEHYIASHASEGLVCLPQVYADGGFSGGTMERPALKRLIADIEAGLVDCVIVYKVDRLSRSLMDFARMMELFTRMGVSFVSVTQHLSTADSMGRLTLNMLLSFAQFERELASERTRDKIAMTRQRGEWTGGKPVLGYDVVDGGLVLNEAEAPLVRSVFALYLEHGSLGRVLAELERRGVTNKRWTTKAGEERGGHAFTKSTLANLLGNPLYIGRVPHIGKTYRGVHAAIVDEPTYARVQQMLAENGRSGATLTRNKHSGLLKGLLRCGCCDAPMVHTTTTTAKGVVHRYYTCTSGPVRGREACPGAKVPAHQIEQFVLDKVKPRLCEPSLASAVLDAARGKGEQDIRDLTARAGLLDRNAAQHRARGTPEGHAAAEDAERESLALKTRAETVRAGLVQRGDVERGLAAFTPVWASLSPTERTALISLAVQRVTFDGQKGEIAIRLREGVLSPAPKERVA